jgi:LEA14-like dessication related protein
MKKIVCLVSLVLLTSCSLLTVMSEKPEVEVVGVSVKDIGLSGGTLMVDLNIKNPNNNTIQLDSIGYSMSINENPIANGDMKDGVKLLANEEKVVAIPVKFAYQDIANGLTSILKTQKLDYDFSGSAKVGVFNIPFRKKGQLDTKKR